MADLTLQNLVATRLAETPPNVEGAAALVLAAFQGPDALRATLDGHQPAPAPAPDATQAPTATYLAAIEVEGFRGIGPPVTLTLEPSPGLTLVVGRNGSGKSSFAEALEMLLTGSNRRWTERAKVWQDGWRNLHHGPPRITGRFRPDGGRATMTIERRWADEADVAVSTLTIDGKRRDLEENGWSRALESWPPLLSHNELGRILEGRPSELYDALAKILGLGEIAAAETLLRETRLDAERQIRDQEAQAAKLLAQLDGLDDERARSVAEALRQKPWDLLAVERALSTNPIAVEERSALTRLRELSTLAVVPRERVDVAVGELRDIGHELERLWGTDASLARETASLLRQALQVHGPGHEGTDCPVCGTPGVITYQWKLQASARIQDLEAQATSVEAVHQRAQRLLREAHQLVSAPPPVLREAAEFGVDGNQALTCWAVWGTAPEGDDVVQMAAHLEMEATIIEVTRREQSVVELRTALDPVRRYIEDARAVALSKNLPPETHRVVPGFCRYALEAAAREVVTHRLAHEGKPYDEIEAAWDQATTLLMRLALAFFGDETRAGDVMTYLNRQQGPWAGDAVAICNKGAHEAVDREQQMTTIRNVEQLTARMREGAVGHR